MFNFSLKFLKTNISTKPTLNSTPAKPKTKKLKVSRVISSIIAPVKILYEYKIIHINSAYNIKTTMLVRLKKNKNKLSQKIIRKKLIQPHI